MEIIIQPTAEAATKIAARVVAGLIRQKPAAVLGLATGSTPLQLHPKVTVCLDKAAASDLKLRDYSRWVYDN